MIMIFAAALFQAAPASAMTSWIFRTRARDPITDLQSAIASVESTISKARLTVQCDVVGEPIVSILFIPEQFTGSSGSQRVTFRIDDGPSVELMSEPISKAKAITEIKMVRMLAHNLANGKSVYVRAFDYNDQPVNGRFDVAGGETVIRAVFNACKIAYDIPAKKNRK